MSMFFSHTIQTFLAGGIYDQIPFLHCIKYSKLTVNLLYSYNQLRKRDLSEELSEILQLDAVST
jgi:hypothetical protein